MAGNSIGGKKAALTTKQKYGEDFHKKAGSKSWSDPNRSHETGFALQSEEARKEAGRKGGKKTKAEYGTNIESPAKYTKGNGSKVGDEFTLQDVKYRVALVETLPEEALEASNEPSEAEKTSSGVSE